jgi:Iron-containing redox enzyme
MRGQGDLLRRKINFAVPLLHTICTRFWEHKSLGVMFPKFLLTIYGSVRATVPLMNTAVAALKRRPADEGLCEPLIDYLRQHAREEAEHDEWLIQDLEKVGIKRNEVLASPGTPEVARLVGAQYYWIHHAHPIALLAFFAVLEGHPPIASHLDEVQRRTALPSEAFRMLRKHADLDKEHADELFHLLDELPLTPSLSVLLGMSAFHTLDALAAMFQRLVSEADKQRAYASARL